MKINKEMKVAEFGFQTERGWRNQRWMRAKLGMDDKMGKREWVEEMGKAKRIKQQQQSREWYCN